jgi:hypothetical protein
MAFQHGDMAVSPAQQYQSLQRVSTLSRVLSLTGPRKRDIVSKAHRRLTGVVRIRRDGDAANNADSRMKRCGSYLLSLGRALRIFVAT